MATSDSMTEMCIMFRNQNTCHKSYSDCNKWTATTYDAQYYDIEKDK